MVRAPPPGSEDPLSTDAGAAQVPAAVDTVTSLHFAFTSGFGTHVPAEVDQ
jgi:hypothetical protein